MNALFQSLYDKTVIETSRPDKVATTKQALASATLSCHSLDGDFFFRDIHTADVQFDVAPGQQGVYINELSTEALPRYRSLAYIRKWNSTYNASQSNPNVSPPFYTDYGVPIGSSLILRDIILISPNEYLDEYGYERTDVCYQVGSNIMIKSSTPLPAVKMGWYTWPNVDAGNDFTNYTSWIAEQFPFLMVYMAAVSILNGTGEQDVASTYYRPADPRRPGDLGGMLTQQVNQFRRSNVVARGY